MGSVLARITATAVNILYSSGWSCTEFISYNCKPIVEGGVLASISATAVDIYYIVLGRVVTNISDTAVNI